MKPITSFTLLPARESTLTAKPAAPDVRAQQVQPVRFSGGAVPSDFLPRFLNKMGDFFQSAYEWLLIKPYEWLRNQFNALVGWFRSKPKPATATDTAITQTTLATAKPTTPPA